MGNVMMKVDRSAEGKSFHANYVYAYAADAYPFAEMSWNQFPLYPTDGM